MTYAVQEKVKVREDIHSAVTLTGVKFPITAWEVIEVYAGRSGRERIEEYRVQEVQIVSYESGNTKSASCKVGGEAFTCAPSDLYTTLEHAQANVSARWENLVSGACRVVEKSAAALALKKEQYESAVSERDRLEEAESAWLRKIEVAS